jgi:hypothetical protein
VRAAAALLLAVASGACASSPADPFDAAFRDLRVLAAAARPDGDPATVDLLLAPDIAFLRARGADAIPSLERAVATADRVLGAATGRRIRIGGATLFPSTPGVDDDLRLLAEARLVLDRGECDAVAAFTGQRCGERAGEALPEFRLLLGADAEDPERNLLHEAGHLFGTADYRRGHPGYGIDSAWAYDSDRPRSLTLDPANAERIRARGGALVPERADALAAAVRARLAALPGPLAEALRGAFLCAESRHGHADGLAPARRYLARRPGDGAALWMEGECLRVTRETAEAAEAFAEALEALSSTAAPDALDLHAALAIARLAVDGIDGTEGLRGAAEGVLDRMAAAFPGHAELLDLRGSLRARAGDGAAAARLWREAGAAAPGAAYPWRHLAALGRAAGDRDLWLEGWRGVLAADPLDPLAAVAFAAEGLERFPEVIRGPARADARAALDRAAEGFPDWPEPDRRRAAIHGK